MSGPLSSNEIEDVVSSVRRLVSVDARPRPASRELAPDRLVLTPALRVVPEPPPPLILSSPLREDGPELPAAVGISDAMPATDPRAFEAEWEEEIWSEPEPPLAELALGAEEAVVVGETGETEAVKAFPPAPAANLADDPSFVPETVEDGLDGDAAPVVAHEAKSGRTDLSPELLTDSDGNPLTVLDEAALQHLIRQVIREELKGVLGERITQSVRKLVRAEVNRALAAHSLE